MKRSLILGAVTVWLLTGCSTFNSREMAQETAPQQWKSVSALVHSGQQSNLTWWKELKDPQLDRLVEEAINANPDVLTALSAIREARAYRKQAKGVLLPSVKASGGFSSSNNHDTNISVDSYSAVVDASWEPDIFGANRSALLATEAQELAAQADYADTLISLSAEVATNYIALRSYQAQLQITEESLKSWQESVQLTVWQEKAGIVTQLNVEQAKRSYEQTLATIPSLKQNIVDAQYQIAVLLGRQPEDLPQSLLTMTALPQSPTSVFLPMPTEVLRQRPDIRAAEQRVLAAMAQTDAAEANRLPSFALGGNLTFGAGSLSDLFSVSSLVSTVSASVAQTLFDGGQLKAQAEIKQELEAQALLSYRKTVLQALQEIESALANLQHSRETYEALQRATETSKEEEKLALIQYQAGELSFSDVLDAQRTLLSLRKQSVEALASELGQVITLSKAVAGKWAMTKATKDAMSQTGDDKNANE
ncbi:efflux transporter outer membrane subunit [Thiomicrorhabdus sp.]|uniref:efflux transporter outer membrane subunit n=1 Tax=Thiomicrorhabdus sp. TaxID=2039724 RepID=UPI0029C82064|nr:efflux transporter outer membrane subunit [Thiomicrorhabdus sp.]